MSLMLNLSNLQPTTAKKQQNAKDTQKVFIYPSVMFSVIDHYLRRNEKQDRVIGTLLGVRNEVTGIIEIKSCFSVPHFETDTHVEVDMEYHRMFYTALKKANPTEEIVGWYATGSEIGNHSALIQEFYANEAKSQEAIHLIVDTSLESNSLKVQVFSDIGFGSSFENSIGCLFAPVRYEMVYPEAEKNLLQLLATTQKQTPTDLISENSILSRSQPSDARLVSDIEQLEEAIKSLIEMIERVSAYVQKVIAGETQPDNLVGNYLIDMLASVPKIDAETFDSLFQSHLQNLLMVIYLSNLTRAQVNIANRLHHLA
ncbi:hypothetical protein BB561_003568 [Smittium simulii]|uniref:Eukaryotic translation initiation factor 3 subunit F n=1 Tax=Smittium simulii TaxID=133385 RepID=A0A2T9YKN9_9FUNG|nr:hypothetical protein BB561_003568 [Smittium simulii]